MKRTIKRKKLIFFILLFILFLVTSNIVIASAETLQDNIQGQLNNIDFSEIENFINSLSEQEKKFYNKSFYSEIYEILQGNLELNYGTVFNNLLSLVFASVKDFLPSFLTIFAISLFCGIVCSNKSAFLNDSIKDIVFYVCFSSVILLITSGISVIISNSYNTIKNLGNLVEIMLPIILTLMIAGGGNVSAKIYQPAVAFLSNGIIEVYLSVLFPLITILIIFCIISSLSHSVKLDKMKDFISGLAKWILGLTITIFTFFMTIEGLTGASIDGISLRATKYAISNSIPLVGSFLSSGFDLVLAGTILIKNAVGVGLIFLIFSLIFYPLLNLIAYQMMLKLFSAIVEPISDQRFSAFFTSLSKCVSYIIAIILAVSFMLFIVILLLICSANAFI